MYIKWNFRDKPSEDFSDKPAFRPKSSWKLPRVSWFGIIFKSN